jgi:hypothetical protein
MKPTKENSLYLTIKQVYFDQIIAGTKKEEYREIKDTTYKKYIECDEDGVPYVDSSKADVDDPLLGDLCIWNNGVYPYVANQKWQYLSLAVGYHKERDTAIVEIKDITFEPALNQYDKPARFSEDKNGNVEPDENGDLCFWIAVFHLGKVIEVHRK